jgi:molybdopterin-containing oxidoreductase family iron-sulfur binding subunit
MDTPRLDLVAARARLAAARGRGFWRSLEELAAAPEFEEFLFRELEPGALRAPGTDSAGGIEMPPTEFAPGSDLPPDAVSRRQMLGLMGASLALGGLAGCVKQPPEKIVPYVDQPQEIVPGQSLFFATAANLGGAAVGLLVESTMGRPIKVEGNPEHPASLGATDLFAQASILDLYDPDRMQAVSYLGRTRTWDAFVAELSGKLTAQEALGGAGLAVLTPEVSSPTLAAQLAALRGRFPRMRRHVWEPVGLAAGLAARRAFGAPLAASYDLSRASVVLALDSDFLTRGPGAVRYAREFTARRRVWGGDAEALAAGGMLRLYSVECEPTATGTMADHRLALPPSGVAAFALALAAELGVAGAEGAAAPPHPEGERWLRAVAADLRRAGSAALVVPGDHAAPELHVLAHAINAALGAAGSTVVYSEPAAPPEPGAVAAGSAAATGVQRAGAAGSEPVAGGDSAAGPASAGAAGSSAPADLDPDDPAASLAALTAAMAAGEVDVVVILGGNPVYTAPADLGFAEALAQVPFRVYLGLHADETAGWCDWLIPEAHWLEAWSDARAFDGTASIVQPLIEPLYAPAKSAHQVVAALAGAGAADGYELVREHWRDRGLADDDAWRRALHDGVIPDTASPARAVAVDPGAVAAAAGAVVKAARGAAARQAAAAGPAPGGRAPAGAARDGGGSIGAAGDGPLELAFRPDPTIWDGRFANNGWLQECPKPVTRLTWDNALLLAPSDAGARGLASGDLVEVAVGERSLIVPVWVQPGQARGAATLHLGYGRTAAGRVGTGAGADAYRLRTRDALWSAPATVSRAAGHHPLACTQDHWSMEGRHLVRSGTLAEYREHPDFAQHVVHVPGPEESMYPGWDYPGYKWGLSVDLSACTSCNACVVACQAENNVPVVGKEQVLNAREMHWLRIDRYFEFPDGDLDRPEFVHQPVMCQHCENAPCEVVCPVAATVHSAEGLNDMIYNRCVGTRYCSNNCPYKVRRFNFLKWVDTETEVLELARNPEVTVRGRGVMEKCTFCVQRISHARQQAKIEGRRIRDGEVKTACQQVCPSDAIVFGDLNDESAEIVRRKSQPLDYGLLAELNTRPRTSYLARVTNPNPDLAREAAADGHDGHG